ncbi:MAG: T9SS type A sorting domain-containing protein [Flavobacterium sp.]
MKTSITLLLITCISLTGFSQAYQPFPTSNAMWRENSGGFQCSCCSDFQYTITGDTLINTLTYHKLQKTGVKYMEDWIGNCTSNIAYAINQYAGCFRNDSANKMVYFIYSMLSTDTVLYDFNLSIGDTIPPSPINDNGNFINVVTDIDSVFLGGVYRKRFKLDSCWQQLYYIEGIGSTYGLLSPTMCPFEAMYNLQCLTINSLTVYPSNTTTCSIVTSINETSYTNLFSVFPNPTNGTINITTNLQNYDISIFNSTGQLIQKKKSISNSTLFDISDLPPGLYLIQISEDENQLYKQKLIRQ